MEAAFTIVFPLLHCSLTTYKICPDTIPGSSNFEFYPKKLSRRYNYYESQSAFFCTRERGPGREIQEREGGGRRREELTCSFIHLPSIHSYHTTDERGVTYHVSLCGSADSCDNDGVSVCVEQSQNKKLIASFKNQTIMADGESAPRLWCIGWASLKFLSICRLSVDVPHVNGG